MVCLDCELVWVGLGWVVWSLDGLRCDEVGSSSVGLR